MQTTHNNSQLIELDRKADRTAWDSWSGSADGTA